jgi:hypothetical protein
MASGSVPGFVLPGRESFDRMAPLRVFPGGSTKAVVGVYEAAGRRFVVKDVHSMHPWARALYGRQRRREMGDARDVPHEELGMQEGERVPDELVHVERLQRLPGRAPPSRLRPARRADRRDARAQRRPPRLRQKRNVLVTRAAT